MHACVLPHRPDHVHPAAPLQRDLQAPLMNVNINLIVSADLAVIGHISTEAEVRGGTAGLD